MAPKHGDSVCRMWEAKNDPLYLASMLESNKQISVKNPFQHDCNRFPLERFQWQWKWDLEIPSIAKPFAECGRGRFRKKKSKLGNFWCTKRKREIVGAKSARGPLIGGLLISKQCPQQRPTPHEVPSCGVKRGVRVPRNRPLAASRPPDQWKAQKKDCKVQAHPNPALAALEVGEVRPGCP